jgi:hypothetical protein
MNATSTTTTELANELANELAKHRAWFAKPIASILELAESHPSRVGKMCHLLMAHTVACKWQEMDADASISCQDAARPLCLSCDQINAAFDAAQTGHDWQKRITSMIGEASILRGEWRLHIVDAGWKIDALIGRLFPEIMAFRFDAEHSIAYHGGAI